MRHTPKSCPVRAGALGQRSTVPILSDTAEDIAMPEVVLWRSKASVGGRIEHGRTFLLEWKSVMKTEQTGRIVIFCVVVTYIFAVRLHR